MEGIDEQPHGGSNVVQDGQDRAAEKVQRGGEESERCRLVFGQEVLTQRR
jgi:hypothetical protein